MTFPERSPRETILMARWSARELPLIANIPFLCPSEPGCEIALARRSAVFCISRAVTRFNDKKPQGSWHNSPAQAGAA
jgi:hypothetical protein